MAETGERSFGDKVLDTFRPKIDQIIQQYAGRIVFAIPALGDLLKYAVHQVGGGAFSNAVLFGGGWANVPRSMFRVGPAGDSLYRLANEILDELAQAVARTGRELSEEELVGNIEQIVGRLTRREESKGEEAMQKQEGYLWTRREGDEQVQDFHHSDCVRLPPLTTEEDFIGKGGKKGKRGRSNPELRKMSLASAHAQGVRQCGTCKPLFEAAAKPEKEISQPKKKKPLEITVELTQAERDDLLDWLERLTPARCKRVMSEFEKRLTSVEELRGLLAYPTHTDPKKDLRYRAVEQLKDVVQERVEKAGKAAWKQTKKSRKEAQTAIKKASAALAKHAGDEAARQARRDRWKRRLRTGKW